MIKYFCMIFNISVLFLYPVLVCADTYDDLYVEKCLQYDGNSLSDAARESCYEQDGCEFGIPGCTKCEPGTYWHAWPHGTGCQGCENSPFTEDDYDVTLTYGETLVTPDMFMWRWYKDGAKSADGCLWVAACPQGSQLVFGDNVYTCDKCGNDLYDPSGVNFYLGRGTAILNSMSGANNFVDVADVCTHKCPENSGTNENGDGCECDYGYNDSGSKNADGQSICEAADVTVNVRLRRCNSEYTNMTDCENKCTNIEDSYASFTVNYHSAYRFSDLVGKITLPYGYQTSALKIGDVSLTQNDSFSSATISTIDDITMDVCAYPTTVTIKHCYDTNCSANTTEESKCISKPRAKKLSELNNYTIPNGQYFTAWLDSSTNAQFEQGAQLLQEPDCHDMTLYLQMNTCSPGYYCTGGTQTKCPFNANSVAGAGQLSDCKTQSESIKICDENNFCFDVSPNLSVYKK